MNHGSGEHIEGDVAACVIIGDGARDREHVGPEGRVLEELRRVLTERGFEIECIKQLSFGAWLVKAKRGIREIVLYVAILGYEKSIEENLAELIRLQYGQQIESSKDCIKKWLDKHKLRDYELVCRANKQVIRKVFPSIARL